MSYLIVEKILCISTTSILDRSHICIYLHIHCKQSIQKTPKSQLLGGQMWAAVQIKLFPSSPTTCNQEYYFYYELHLAMTSVCVFKDCTDNSITVKVCCCLPKRKRGVWIHLCTKLFDQKDTNKSQYTCICNNQLQFTKENADSLLSKKK